MSAAAVVPAPILTEADRRAAWLADRQRAITGTDAAKILGLSKWGGPFDVWLSKRGLAEPTPDNEPMKWGRRLERTILMAYGDEEGVPVEFADPYQLLRHPSLSMIGATLDGRRGDPSAAPVDAKNVRWPSGEWGESGSDLIPTHYAVQLTMQMAVTDTDFADLAVLFSGQDFRIYRLHRDRETEAVFLNRLADWWARHIVGGVEPAPDATAGDYLNAKFRQASDELRPATLELEQVAQRLAVVRAEIKARETEEAEAENILKAAIGEAKGLAGRGFKATWAQSKDSSSTDWKGVAQAIARDQGLASDALNAYVLSHTTTKPGARRFLFTLREGGAE